MGTWRFFRAGHRRDNRVSAPSPHSCGDGCSLPPPTVLAPQLHSVVKIPGSRMLPPGDGLGGSGSCSADQGHSPPRSGTKDLPQLSEVVRPLIFMFPVFEVTDRRNKMFEALSQVRRCFVFLCSPGREGEFILSFVHLPPREADGCSTGWAPFLCVKRNLRNPSYKN